MKRSLNVLLISIVIVLAFLVILDFVVGVADRDIIKQDKTVKGQALVTSEANNQIIIKKTDLNGNPLANTEYTITLNNVRELRVNGSDLITYSPTSGGNDTYNVGLSEETNLYNIISKSHSRDNYSGKLKINVSTDSEGLIVLTDIKPFHMGDVNMDGVVGNTDKNLIINSELTTENQIKLADLNYDNVVNSLDGETLSAILDRQETGGYAVINGIVSEIEGLEGYQKVVDKKFVLDLNRTNNTMTIVEDFSTDTNIEDSTFVNIVENESKTKEIVVNTGIPQNECTIIINNVKQLRVNGSEIISYSPTSSGNDTYVINSNGEITKSHSKVNYSGKITITVESDAEGKIILSDIEQLFKGDISMDGTVDHDDARWMQRLFAGLEEFTSAQNYLADVNASESVASDDWSTISKAGVGLEHTDYAEVYGSINMSELEPITFGTRYGEDFSDSTKVEITKDENNSNKNTIIIKKLDEEGNAIVGKTYTINLNYIHKVKVNGSEEIKYSPEKTNEGKDTYTVSANGEIITSTHSDNKYSGKLVITATTNEEGKIVLSEVEPFYKGDIEMDGAVGSEDARLALRASVRIRNNK